jgi:hypothetical protein
LSLFKVRRNIELERHMAALIVPDFLPVDPDRRAVVNRAEVEQQILTAPIGGHIEAARIPDDFVDCFIVNAR